MEKVVKYLSAGLHKDAENYKRTIFGNTLIILGTSVASIGALMMENLPFFLFEIAILLFFVINLWFLGKKNMGE